MPSWQSVKRTWELVNDVKARSAIRKGGGMIASCIQSVSLKSFLPVSTRSQGGVRLYVLRTRCGKISLRPAKQTQRGFAQKSLRMFVYHICSICNDRLCEITEESLLACNLLRRHEQAQIGSSPCPQLLTNLRHKEHSEAGLAYNALLLIVKSHL
jgi:hypothetical protein